MLKSELYRILKGLVGVFFNILNFLLVGNLPPFGCVCVVVEEQGKYLMVARPEGGYVFPSGFMRWREHPAQTAQRECEEETGLRLQINSLIGCSSHVSDRFTHMSTLSVIYEAEVIGGQLRDSIEGRACWLDKADIRKQLHVQQRGIWDHFLQYREQREQV